MLHLYLHIYICILHMYTPNHTVQITCGAHVTLKVEFWYFHEHLCSSILTAPSVFIFDFLHICLQVLLDVDWKSTSFQCRAKIKQLRLPTLCHYELTGSLSFILQATPLIRTIKSENAHLCSIYLSRSSKLNFTCMNHDSQRYLGEWRMVISSSTYCIFYTLQSP